MVTRNKGLTFLMSLLGTNEEQCVTWPFATRADGRGTLWVGGRQELANRAMCRLAHGDPASHDHVAAHSCGNGHLGCVNPNHLRWATIAENAADTLSHGTRQYGEANPSSRLNPNSVAEIRRLCQSHSQRALAAKFGVSKSTVRKVIVGETWVNANGD